MTFDITEYLNTKRVQVDQALRDYLPAPTEHDDIGLRKAIAHALLDGGKRLRPCLTIAAAEAVGGTTVEALPGACALEMVHAYSLVHDDLPSMDDDDLRRGKPTVHKQFGEAAAVLTGDALLTLAFGVLAKAGAGENTGAKAEGRAAAYLSACAELARAAGVDGMVGGQAIDMGIKEKTPSFQLIEDCHALKTAALFAGAAAVGALVGGGSTKEVDQLRTFGFELGLAFQHADDLRDADFPEYKKTSLSRCAEKTAAAATIAKQFGNEGIPLVELTKLVEQRAREVA